METEVLLISVLDQTRQVYSKKYWHGYFCNTTENEVYGPKLH